jgi:tetratricopeptide (TPR) repeat protein
LAGASQFGRAAVQLAVPERGSMSTKTASSPAAPKSNRKGPKSTRGESPKRSQKSARKKGKTPRAKPTGAGEGLSSEAAILMSEVFKTNHSSAPSVSGVEDETELQAKGLREQGKYGDAERLWRQVLAARRTALGDRHASTVSTLDQLGATLYMKGDLVGAEELLLEALEARRATLGDQHPDTVASVSSCGMLLKDMGDLARAEPLLREAVTAMRESIGEHHPDALICMANLGVLLKDKGDLDAAEPLLRDALRAMRETLGDAHPATLVNIVQLGLVLMAKKEYGVAEGLLVEALQACRFHFGDAHPQTLASITHLASLYEATGDIETALPLHQEVLAGFEATNHPMTVRCADHVSTLLRAISREDEADALFSKFREWTFEPETDAAIDAVAEDDEPELLS